MAFFAKINETGEVVSIVVSENMPSSAGTFVEYFENPGDTPEEVAASAQANPRKNPAFIGGYYYSDGDYFMPPKPYESWVIDIVEYQWVAPVSYPLDGLGYTWDEPTTSWIPE